MIFLIIFVNFSFSANDSGLRLFVSTAMVFLVATLVLAIQKFMLRYIVTKKRESNTTLNENCSSLLIQK
jgi:hypothetical protein